MAREYQHPQYFEYYREFIPDYDQFVLAQKLSAPVHVRRNLLKCSVETFENFLNRHISDGAFATYKKITEVPDCYEIQSDRPVVGGLWEHHIGLYYMQGASSLLPVMALDPKPHEL